MRSGERRCSSSYSAAGTSSANYRSCAACLTSHAWQHDQAEATITGEGRITEEFFDRGRSRTLAWHLRPEAARLIEAIKDPNRGFDAIVIGSYERAFYSNQASLILPLLEKHSVALWMPEVGGRITAGHDELVALLGILAKREIIRARARTVGAMTALVRDYGRYVGGRPAYGYRLVAVGPHPKRQHAAWGRKLLCLEPNPDTAPVVVWVFQMRLDGHTLARSVRALNDAAIPCPSAADPRRNPHRAAVAWQIPTVQAILSNPVYTGHAVWKRTYAEHELVDENNLALGFAQHVRRNAPDQWAISIPIAHEALLSEEQFVAVQSTHSPRPDQVHDYRYTGILPCGECARRRKDPATTAPPPTAAGTDTPAPAGPRAGHPRRTSANPTCSPGCRYSTTGSSWTARR